MIISDVHPGPSAGDGRLEPRRTTYKRGDRIIELRKCAQCGFINRDGIEVTGDSQDSPGIQQTSSQETDKYVQNIVPNGSFEGWPYGDAVRIQAADLVPKYFAENWYAAGVLGGSITVAQKSKDSVDGGSSLNWKITALGLTNIKIRSDDFTLPTDWVGKQLILDGWVKSTLINNDNSLQLAYGNSTISTNNPTADGAWHYVVTSAFIPSTAVVHIVYNPTNAPFVTSNTFIDKIRLYKYSQQTINDPNVVAGCRLCGSLNSKGIDRNVKDYGTGIDLSNK